jgi:hypothetical protein
VAEVGVILRVVTSTGTQARQTLVPRIRQNTAASTTSSHHRSFRAREDGSGRAWLEASAIETVALAGSP